MHWACPISLKKVNTQLLTYDITVYKCVEKVISYHGSLPAVNITSHAIPTHLNTLLYTDTGSLYTFGDGRHGKLGQGEESFCNLFTPTKVARFKGFFVEQVRIWVLKFVKKCVYSIQGWHHNCRSGVTVKCIYTSHCNSEAGMNKKKSNFVLSLSRLKYHRTFHHEICEFCYF